jgi:hypothetical protein
MRVVFRFSKRVRATQSRRRRPLPFGRHRDRRRRAIGEQRRRRLRCDWHRDRAHTALRQSHCDERRAVGEVVGEVVGEERRGQTISDTIARCGGLSVFV